VNHVRHLSFLFFLATVPAIFAPGVARAVWQFTSKMLFIVLTGVFSAALALSAIENNINTVGGLRGKRTAVVAGNAPEASCRG